MSFEADEEILQDFLVESGEILEQLSEQLVDLEQNPNDKDLLNAIFRGFQLGFAFRAGEQYGLKPWKLQRMVAGGTAPVTPRVGERISDISLAAGTTDGACCSHNPFSSP